jgi:hypothetical protein
VRMGDFGGKPAGQGDAQQGQRAYCAPFGCCAVQSQPAQLAVAVRLL